MIVSFINIHLVPREVLNTEGAAKVNEWKIMFDPMFEVFTCVYLLFVVPVVYRVSSVWL